VAVSGFPEVAVWRALSWLSHITVPPADTVTVGGSYPFPPVAEEEPSGITTVVSPPPPALVALAAPAAVVVFVV
jgi:hypothetical protein